MEWPSGEGTSAEGNGALMICSNVKWCVIRRVGSILTAAARGEIDIVVQCRGFLEELDRRGDHLVVSEEMIAKLRQTYVDFCRQRRQ